MNDQELNEVLGAWNVPPPTGSMRTAVQGALDAQTKRKTSRRLRFAPGAWKGLFAGVAAAAVVLMIATTAFPQAAAPPFTVDSEFVGYAPDGRATVLMHSTSYSIDGNEITLNRSLPNPMQNAMARTMDFATSILGPVHSFIAPLFIGAEQFKRYRSIARVTTGCGDAWCHMAASYTINDMADLAATGCLAGRTPVGTATILGYRTTAIERPIDTPRRLTLWMAPDLSCFALKVVTEDRQPDGTWRLVSGKQALRVNRN